MSNKTKIEKRFEDEVIVFSFKTTDDENGFMWIVYDEDDAHLYSENYDPDQQNAWDLVDSFCNDYINANYS